jgi:hypothetical protein
MLWLVRPSLLPSSAHRSGSEAHMPTKFIHDSKESVTAYA